MKIGIFTIYDAYNAGSFLQAFSLYQYFKGENAIVCIVDCSKDRLRWIKRIIATTPRKQYIKIKRRINYGKAWKKLEIVPFSEKEKYDLAIIGSDEIWNVENKYFEHCEQYFGSSVIADKIIAYAPSVGFSKIESILNNSQIIMDVQNIDLAYARDENTKVLMEKLFKKSIDRVCDPTLLLYDKWHQWEVPLKIDGDYLMLYGYGDFIDLEEEIKLYAKNNNLKIVSVAFDNSWADKVVIPSPFQFLYLVHNAKAIMGGTFHISVFATIFSKRFCIKSDMQKTIDFLEISGQINHLYKNKGDFEKCLDSPTFDWSEQSELLDLIDKSKNLLQF